MANRIDSLKQRQERIAARIKHLQAREKTEHRKAETRRNILVGALIRARMKRDEAFEARVLKMLDAELKREIDRNLFLLPPQRSKSETSR